MAEYDPRNSVYFQSLPRLVQESIMQSSVTFYSEEEVKAFAKRFQEDNKTPIE